MSETKSDLLATSKWIHFGRREKLQAKICTTDGCDKAGVRYQATTDDLFCVEHHLPALEKRHDELRNALADLCYVIDPVHPDAQSWVGIAKHCQGVVLAAQETARVGTRIDEIRNSEIEALRRRVRNLEAERGPGMKAPQPVITCDLGEDYE